MEQGQIEEIFLLFSYKEENENAAHKAFDQLYKEYSKFLKGFIRKQLNSMGINDEQVLDSTISNTFISIYQKPPLEFKPKSGKSFDDSFKAYLSVTAKHEILSLYKEYYKLNSVVEIEGDEIVFEDTEIDDNIAVHLNTKMMEAALNTLSERDRGILRMLYNYHEEGKNSPSSVLDSICQIYGTTKPNIRQIKKRSETKIIEYFSKFSTLKAIKNV
ncbi:sigma-70 family RNA polymerase sigma factor [Parasediminibacterium sp. JCM 36343]|uniref:sigma-70 family RNA polymerase sigma factor n=1 Tax=Parasediminibacterium sp. JCM 36343 TaxID=3374279 RepID=UPI00397CDE8C